MDRRDRIGFADLAKFAYENRHTFVCLFTAVQPALSLVLISAPQTHYKKHTTRVRFFYNGADNRIRTGDTRYHKPVL